VGRGNRKFAKGEKDWVPKKRRLSSEGGSEVGLKKEGKKESEEKKKDLKGSAGGFQENIRNLLAGIGSESSEAGD